MFDEDEILMIGVDNLCCAVERLDRMYSTETLSTPGDYMGDRITPHTRRRDVLMHEPPPSAVGSAHPSTMVGVADTPTAFDMYRVETKDTSADMRINAALDHPDPVHTSTAPQK